MINIDFDNAKTKTLYDAAWDRYMELLRSSNYHAHRAGSFRRIIGIRDDDVSMGSSNRAYAYLKCKELYWNKGIPIENHPLLLDSNKTKTKI